MNQSAGDIAGSEQYQLSTLTTPAFATYAKRT